MQSAHDGYFIETTDKAVKTSTGFTRYRLELKGGGEKLEFVVTEEAESAQEYEHPSSIRSFLEFRRASSVQDEPLPTGWLQHAKAVLQKADSIAALRAVASSNFTESDVAKWKNNDSLLISKPLLQRCGKQYYWGWCGAH
jgi:hypothetical protein